MSNITKRQKDLLLIILAAVFLIVLVAYSYFLVYAPVKATNDQLKQTMETEREVLFVLRQEAAKKEKSDSSSTLQLQQKVPVKPLEDAVLLQITKAEIKSNSIVKDVAFVRSPFDIATPPESVENVSQLLTTVAIEVEAYSDLMRFISELENMERFFVVDSIKFVGPDEVKEMGVERELIPLTVSFSAFYRSDLENLVNETPKINAPSGSQKSDPFSFNKGSAE